MTIEIRDGDGMRQLRDQLRADGRSFRFGRSWVVFDACGAQELNLANYGDLRLPDRLADLLRGRKSPEAPWKDVRAAWASRLAKLTAPSHVAALEDRMASLVEERTDRSVDLPWAIQEVFTRALIPTVVADLSAEELSTVLADQQIKLARLMRIPQREDTRREKLRSALFDFRAGRVLRRVLRERARARRARRLDMADPMVDLLPILGMDRAAFAVSTVLTAIAGPPGAVAVCLLLELVHRPEWAARLEEEMRAAPRARFHAAPFRVAPTAHRFVREVLRFWSAPLVLTRVVQKPLQSGAVSLEVGDELHLSPYFAHHDPREWDDPDTFDPDRWLAGSKRGPAHACAYAPFGWSPTSCVGAGLGTIELMLLCRLFTTRYRLVPEDLDSVEVVLASVPLPVGFRGTIERR